MDLRVFPILNTPSSSLPIPSFWVIPVHQPRALVSCIQPGLAICFTLDNIHVSMLFSHIIPLLTSPIDPKLWYASRMCMSSLRRGHANLLCIIPILVYVLLKSYKFYSSQNKTSIVTWIHYINTLLLRYILRLNKNIF